MGTLGVDEDGKGFRHTSGWKPKEIFPKGKKFSHSLGITLG
jgi:hypothetical protein